jgi:hypothetical protein
LVGTQWVSIWATVHTIWLASLSPLFFPWLALIPWMLSLLPQAFTGMARISYSSMRDGSLQPWSQALQQLPALAQQQQQQQQQEKEGRDPAAASSLGAAVDQACGSAVLSNTVSKPLQQQQQQQQQQLQVATDVGSLSPAVLSMSVA